MRISPIRKSYRQVILSCVMLALGACGGEGDVQGGGQVERGPSPEDLLVVRSQLDMARLYRDQGQFRASTIEAQNALQLVPDDSGALVFMAQLSQDMGDDSRAVELLRAALDARPGDVQVAFRLSESLLVSGEVEEARQLLEGLSLSTSADQDELNLLLGTIEMRNGDLAAAEVLFDRVLASDPNNIDALILRSQIESQSGAIDRAREFLDQAIGVEPENLDLWIWRAQFAMLEEDYPEAEEAYAQALNIMALYDTMTAKKFSVMQAIVTTLQLQQKDDEALQYTQLLAETPRGQIINDYTTALNMYRRGDMQQADEALSNILSLAPGNANSNILMGMTRYAQGNFVAANDLLSEFVEIENAAPLLLKTLAAARLRVNQPDLALSSLEQALEQYPEDPSLLALRGAAQQALGSFEESIESFRQALSLSTGSESAEMHLALAASHFQIQDFSSAEEGLLEALRLNPLSQEAKTLLIDVHLVQGNLQQASDLSQTWLADDPESIFYNEAAAVVALRQGEIEQARGYFENILGVDSSHIQSNLSLARLDLLEENYEAAIERFESVLRIQIDNSDAIGGLLAAGAGNGTEGSSIAAVEQIIAENEDLFVPALTLAQYYLATNRVELGREYADLAYARDENFLTEGAIIDVRLLDAAALRAQQNVAAALNLVESSLSMQENHIQAITMAAALNADRGDFDQAKTYVARLQEILPEVPFPYEVGGDLALAEGDFETALESFERAWELGISSNLGVKLHDLYREMFRAEDSERLLVEWTQALPGDVNASLLLGMNYQGLGRNAEAVTEYEKAFALESDNLLVLNNLAWLYQDSAPSRALELASRAAELYPDNADVLDTYGWILSKQNKRSEAIEVLQRAVELSPESQSIREHLDTVQAQAN